ncbi:MAG: GNAT family N-acetyltransferase [Candidatus Eisenbacteria bacterium]|uniref:GNAT family N-acetyltransferase n=1 Tax=Eiseniibacteriota bacterium TaxID=2212470 RepID=A0A956LY06_UNCEI|nr:GNAT family N-acetyltransferase [Candidatus Eisenbacteria bacterium]
MSSTPSEAGPKTDRARDLSLVVCRQERDLPDGVTRDALVRFFHETMKPYQDEPTDVSRALDYAFSGRVEDGGYLVLAVRSGEIQSGLLMLNTQMGGYVPQNLLLFVATRPELRGQGIGKMVCERAIEECQGDVKLHVEYDNPAKHLYERLGFRTKYAEMRLSR